MALGNETASPLHNLTARHPWDVLDQEIIPHLTVDGVFGELRGLQREGLRWRAFCPVHQGGNAQDLRIHPQRLEWICLGGCGGGGPIQFLQKTQNLSWIEAAQALSLIAGVDPAHLKVWGRHWNEEDFKQHTRLEHRSALLGLFILSSSALLLSEAGSSLRGFLSSRQGFPEGSLEELGLGLYTSPEIVYTDLKKTGLDLAELRGRGFFQPKWSGWVVTACQDVSGRTLNLWAWNPTHILKSDNQAVGEFLFEQDFLGGRSTPFQLFQALQKEKHDLLLVDDPLQALLPRAHGLDDPFPVAASGGLTRAQVDVLERVLADDGSITLCSAYRTGSYASSSDRTSRNLKVLENSAFPVYAIDSKLFADEDGKDVTINQFIQKHGFQVFVDLLEQGQIIIAPETPSRGSARRRPGFWPGLTQVLQGFHRGPAERPLFGDPNAEESEAEARSFQGFDPLFKAAEALGQRIAHGFLKGLPGTFQQSPADEINPALPAPRLQLPAQVVTATPPRVFSVDRLETEGLRTLQVRSTGWKALDVLGARFRPGELTIAGGRTGQGKTAFLAGLLLNWLRTDVAGRLVFCTLEESEVQIYQRLLSLLTSRHSCGWSINDVRNHLGAQPDHLRALSLDPDIVEEARNRLRRHEDLLQITYRPAWTLDEFEHHIRELAEDGLLSAVLFDPLDQISLHGGTSPDRNSNIARRLKSLAVEAAVPVISSFRLRGVSAPESKPEPQHFEEDVFQEADLVLGLHKPASPAGGRSDVTRFEIGILKNRAGPTGQWAQLTLEPNYCLIRDRLIDASPE